jgi:hypothetical protein
MDIETANLIIDRLGGTSETARLCEVKPPSVSEWRKAGIPKAQTKFLRLLRPDVFEDLPADIDHALDHPAEMPNGKPAP